MNRWMGKIKALILLGFVSLVLAACGKENLTALDPKGYGAEVSMDIMILSIIIMIAVFVIVMLVYTVAIIRFRRKKGQENYIPKQVEGNHKLEIVWTAIPIVLVIILAVPTIFTVFDLADDADASESISIDVTGNQYWWHFNYSNEEIQTSQDMYIPVNEKVYLNIDSADVIHSFWVPTISGKMDANPENTNTMYIEAYEEGVYWGKCAELCGPSHSLMDFKIVVVSQEEYDQWVEDMKSVDPEAEPETASAQEGKDLFEANSCIGCHAIGSSPSAVGPNLTNFANRTTLAGVEDLTYENLVDWLMNPEALKPGNKMTGNYPELSEDEASSIAEYLLGLDHSEINPESAGNE
ncbi:cytochrome c oxidase subunit II [Oceanobacillus piezotolerans]|uniref:Cytochrome c oxidase subunit 2 n=1 Tax=Oceanobacillus piezotolerans TaxID=2448030 RepID=A0A498D664_9BACI|nr:cytochrome c oxidase subunit II [Oceanobacillus piezotolerans]RLL45208.1 cytochrome c oxidase subunit II [Oceanobacillus piezotolerans]